MIVEFTEEEIKNSTVVDIGRPSFTKEEHFGWWQNFFNFIEITDIKIQVNALYYKIKDMAFSNKPYCGGGFSFLFWFKTKECRKEFVNAINNNLQANYYHDVQNIRFIQKEDKVFHLLVDEKYLEKTKAISNLEITPHVYKDLFGHEIKQDGHYAISGPIEELLKIKSLLHEYALSL